MTIPAVDTSTITSQDGWIPTTEEYTPGISKEQWLNLLNDESIIGPVWGGVLAAFYKAGGQATCTQIAEKYNKTAPGISGKALLKNNLARVNISETIYYYK